MKLFFLFFICITLMVSSAYATNCGNGVSNCLLNTTTDVGNAMPNITSINVGNSITLTANTNTSKIISFIASDGNGYIDLRSGSITLQQNGYNITSLYCNSTQISSSSKNYTCLLSIPYYSIAGVWNVTARVNDSVNNIAYKYTTITINRLDALEYDNLISWTGIIPGTTNNEALPVTFTNKGNTQYSSLFLTGYGSTSGLDTINATNYGVALTTGQCASRYSVIAGTPISVSGASLNIQGSQQIFACVNIPDGTPTGSYISDNNWVFDFQ